VSTPNPTAWTVADYERAAEEYLLSLPLEHFMESNDQSTQRKITLESLDLLHRRRPDAHVFSEMLVQYPINEHLGQVVPDNFVVLSEKRPGTDGSYNLPFEQVPLFWVLEYVSPSNRRKDYEDNFLKYQRELNVPYYLLFEPARQKLLLYRHNGVGYEEVTPNEAGRLPLPELELEVGLLNTWVRFWHRGELLALPADLEERAERAEREAEQERERARKEKERAKKEKERARKEKERAEKERRRAEQAEQLAEQERQRVLALEAELARLRGQGP
jgi:Uma2 family endonuclease